MAETGKTQSKSKRLNNNIYTISYLRDIIKECKALGVAEIKISVGGVHIIFDKASLEKVQGNTSPLNFGESFTRHGVETTEAPEEREEKDMEMLKLTDPVAWEEAQISEN